RARPPRGRDADQALEGRGGVAPPARRAAGPSGGGAREQALHQAPLGLLVSPVVPPGPDGRHGPHLFVTDLEHPELTPADRHHLERVLRLRAGDDLTVGDGDGRWRMVRFAHPLDVAGPILQAPPLSPQLTVAVALT